MARRSTKCEYKGKKFDSLVEREYYKILEQRQANGEIFNLRIQEKYILQEGFRDSDGVKIQAITYAADQVYEDKDGITHIVDVKGSLETVEQVFLVKWKMLKNTIKMNFIVIFAFYRFSVNCKHNILHYMLL